MTLIGEVEAAPWPIRRRWRFGQIVEVVLILMLIRFLWRRWMLGKRMGPTIVSGLVNFCSAEELTNRLWYCAI